jgi:hypothetical protein
MIYPLVRELADDGFSVRLTCRVLKFSPQGYYRWARRPISHRDYENAYLTNALVDAHRKYPAFGYRFLADELERNGKSHWRARHLAPLFTGRPLGKFCEEITLKQDTRTGSSRGSRIAKVQRKPG